MGVLRRIGIAIGIIIGSFIILFLAIGIIDQIVIFNEKAEAAYDSSYEEAYADIYDVRYKEGYDKEYELARDVGYQEGYNQGYDKGDEEGYDSGYKTGFDEGIGTNYLVRNPTYKELMEFLARDKTDSKPYIEGEYVSSDFAAEVNNNAELEGIRAAFVGIDYPQPPGHGMVAFQTVDEGLIFIEPQSDERVKLVVGKRFYLSIEPKPGYYYEKPSYDDTVVKIQIIW